MSGCIAAFERIDGRVQRIETYSGSEPDTFYERQHGKWIAIEPRHVSIAREHSASFIRASLSTTCVCAPQRPPTSTS
jgi:hypothetical protein